MSRILLTSITFAMATSALAAQVTVDPFYKSTKTIAQQKVELPQGPVEVAASIYMVEPGASLPVHRHAFQRFGYVLSGELTVRNHETGKSQTFHTGDFIVESVGVWHSGSNTGREQLKLLVIDQAPEGAKTTELQN